MKKINFYVESKKLADKLLKELRGKQEVRVHIYAGGKLIHNKRIKYDYY